MKLMFGKKIKMFRTGKKWTQEMLAERLGVSVQAVSRWENDSSFPDIELLPDLATLFDVSVDDLLGVSESTYNHKIEKCIKEANSCYYNGDISKMVSILEKGVAENPASVVLKLKLVIALSSLYDGNREETCHRIIELGEKIEDKMVSLNDKCSLYQIMAYTYFELGESELASMWAKKLPDISYSSNFVFSVILGETKKLECLQENIQILGNYLIIQIQNLVKLDVYSNKEKICILKKVISFFQIMYEDNDYGYDNYLLMCTYFEMAKVYVKLLDIEQVIFSLRKAYDYAVRFDNLKSVIEHSSLIRNKLKFDLTENFGKDYMESEVQQLLTKIEDEYFLEIRDCEEFKILMKEMKGSD